MTLTGAGFVLLSLNQLSAWFVPAPSRIWRGAVELSLEGSTALPSLWTIFRTDGQTESWPTDPDVGWQGGLWCVSGNRGMDHCDGIDKALPAAIPARPDSKPSGSVGKRFLSTT